MAVSTVTEPIPIHRVADKYLLHDADTVAYLRREHNITGVFIGGLPQASQQNVFLGLPLELMPEEARLLVEKNAAYIVDDAAQHMTAFVSGGLSSDDKARFAQLLDHQASEAARTQILQAQERKDTALKKIAQNGKEVGNGDMNNWNDMPDGMLAPRPRGGGRTKSRRRGVERSASSSAAPTPHSDGPPGSSGPPSGTPSAPPSGPPSRTRTPVGRSPSTGRRAHSPQDESDTGKGHQLNGHHDEESLFSSTQAPSTIDDQPKNLPSITPSTSYPPLRVVIPSDPSPLPLVPPSYPLFTHLHSKGYFLSPGLRFGCRYVAYPGDPLRFHSHFLVEGKGWDDKFELMELVGGGRLGTGVKKGYLLGGVEEGEGKRDGDDRVRTYTVEWAGM